jgi:hypothetical protein
MLLKKKQKQSGVVPVSEALSMEAPEIESQDKSLSENLPKQKQPVVTPGKLRVVIE